MTRVLAPLAVLILMGSGTVFASQAGPSRATNPTGKAPSGYSEPGPAAKQPAARSERTMRMTGTVVSADATRVVLRDTKGNEMTFILTPETHRVANLNLKAGERVSIRYRMENHERIATQVS